VRVSVVMPAYNAERFLAQALASVLIQTHRAFELIVVDDGSTDGTLRIARDCARHDNRVHVITQANGGVARALNAGVALAQHDWIVRMDADDVMEPERVERQLAFLAANPDVSVTSSLVRYITEHDRVVGLSRSPFTRRGTATRYARQNRIVAINHPASMVRRSAFLEVGGYRPHCSPAEDIDLWGRLLDHGYQLQVQPEYLLRYRVHGGSAVGQTVSGTERRLDWLRRCTALRRSGLPEISFDIYQQELARDPWWRRWNRLRSETGAARYGQAVFSLSAGAYARAGQQLLAAALMRPGLVARRLGPRLLPTLRRRVA
jgi:glycosyltransferase involved in cell wall biosynthesis